MKLLIILITVTSAATAGAKTGKGAPDKVVRKLERSLLAGDPGAKKVGRVHSGYLEQHQSKAISIHLEEKRCYKFVAAGTEGAKDLSLVLRHVEREVARDRISGKRPAMRWCSAQKGAVTVEVSMYEGEGAFVLLVLEDKKAKGPAKKVGGEGSDFVAIRIRQLHAQYAEGKRAYTPLIRGNLATKEAVDEVVGLKAGRCYVVIASGSAAVRDLAVSVRDAEGGTLAEDETRNAYPVISDVCPKSTGMYQLHVVMVEGSGPFGVQVFAD